MPRFHCPVPLSTGARLMLPAGAARHVQVLRLQPGALITLFNGDGGEWTASILRMGRADVEVQVQSHNPVEREPVRPVHLALGMPANERMDWLVEKAAELGVASITPLQTTHSVLRLSGERAQKKSAHWQSVAAAACEQCGGNRVPAVQPIQDLSAWLKTQDQRDGLRCVLSLSERTRPLGEVLQGLTAHQSVSFLSGPEGGLSAKEDAQAREAGFIPVTLGPRTLRAETAALVALAQTLGR